MRKTIKTSLKEILKRTNNKKWEIKITHENEYYFNVKFIKVSKPCYFCKTEFHKSALFVRHDKRVKGLLVPKPFCKKCVKLVDNLISKLKSSVPHHLKIYSK